MHAAIKVLLPQSEKRRRSFSVIRSAARLLMAKIHLVGSEPIALKCEFVTSQR